MKDAILAQLGTEYSDKNFYWFDSTDSTNNRAKQLAAANAPGKTVVLARQQTAGRGRLGRSFSSPAEMGIYLSVILRPQCAPGELMHLTCAAAVAVCNALESAAQIRPGIKWTNDLVWSGKKLGGILTELSINPESGLVDYAVIGVGINCCQRNRDFPLEIQSIATSLTQITGKDADYASVCAALIRSLTALQDNCIAQKMQWMAQYRLDCITLGKQIQILRGEQRQCATAISVDESGGLTVRLPDGALQTVTSGEVSIRGMYGYIS